MKNKILITYSIPKEGLTQLETHFDLIYPEKEFFTKEELIELIPHCIGLLSIFNREVSADIIKAGKNLKIISNYGVGFNNIDMNAANEQEIIVCNTPEAVCEPTAELCMGLLLSLSRQISLCNYGLKTNPEFEWGVMKNLGSTLRGKTLGIVGMGNIGKSVAEKAMVFGMNIAYHNRKPISEIKWKDAVYMNLPDLLEKSDVISLHCPLTPETHHLLNEKEFLKMKKTAFLINTSRGAVINEVDLAIALEQGEIAGAALDVFENEPIIHPKLLTQKTALAVPHIGTATIETRIEMSREACQNIIEYLKNGITKNRVNQAFF
ncbi:NAD(P)-dependent oxidoreductase [Labilibaculum euxinus]|uniref:Dihydrofolate reductase n=1 Tax=Labilibaculum euxinus TaxID=2686357 RepID=A0A7M4DBL6_9BACT|nr:NAD(P)-dependent oxidoreductase [Labilibaculum euxinus]MUP40045.1 dihydrofolate reductase [Labilibaculum euxinus]MVB09250.1 dihydrofolate reductase [Labilibaculum euxinus]